VVEGVTAERASSPEGALAKADAKQVSVLVDPEAEQLPALQPQAVIDARMLKREVNGAGYRAPILIGLGPGFIASGNCDAVIETERGPQLGRVILEGRARPYTGIPAPVSGVSLDRVLRAPRDGPFSSACHIGDAIRAGERVGDVSGMAVVSPIGGVVRGLLRSGLEVTAGQKLGDIDPRGERARCFRMSRKARTIGEGALQALLLLNRRV
jgi:xanthine dehydrogenase accessory factor